MTITEFCMKCAYVNANAHYLLHKYIILCHCSCVCSSWKGFVITFYITLKVIWTDLHEFVIYIIIHKYDTLGVMLSTSVTFTIFFIYIYCKNVVVRYVTAVCAVHDCNARIIEKQYITNMYGYSKQKLWYITAVTCYPCLCS